MRVGHNADQALHPARRRLTSAFIILLLLPSAFLLLPGNFSVNAHAADSFQSLKCNGKQLGFAAFARAKSESLAALDRLPKHGQSRARFECDVVGSAPPRVIEPASVHLPVP